MATYTMLTSDSKGSDVKKLQQSLVDAGYSVGSAGVDGIYGSATAAAVKKYQQDNGLKVDGIAGDETLGSLYGSKTTSSPSSPSTSGSSGSAAATTTTPAASKTFKYDPYQEGDAVKQAEAMLQQQISQKPGAYQAPWSSKLDAIMERIMNREDFHYDLNGDALYRQYKDQYTTKGLMAMMDTMGQAATLTGGYGNSYAQSVGQQAYQGYLQESNNIIPELYQMAYDRYNQEGQEMYDQAALITARDEQDYGRYRDQVSDYYTGLDYLTGRYDSERDADYSKWADGRDFAYGQYADDKAYAYQEERDKVADEQWQAEFDEAKRQYDQQHALSASKASGSGSSGGGSGGGGSYDAETAEMQKKLNSMGANLTVDGIWGAKTQAAYEKYMGGDSPASTGFTGSTYEEAVSYMKANGVDSGAASGIMTAREWARRKNSYQQTGQGGAEVKNYSSYKEYLQDVVAYHLGE